MDSSSGKTFSEWSVCELVVVAISSRLIFFSLSLPEQKLKRILDSFARRKLNSRLMLTFMKHKNRAADLWWWFTKVNRSEACAKSIAMFGLGSWRRLIEMTLIVVWTCHIWSVQFCDCRKFVWLWKSSACDSTPQLISGLMNRPELLVMAPRKKQATCANFWLSY